MPAGKVHLLARSRGRGRGVDLIAAVAHCEAHYCAVVVRSVVLPVDGLCCAGLALTPSFLISFLVSALPSICLASAVLAAPLCLPFFLLGSYSGRAASAAICSAVRVGPV